MARCCYLVMVCFAGLIAPCAADAQHHYHAHQRSNGEHGSPFQGGGFLHRHGYGYGRLTLVPAYVNLPPQVAYYPNPVDFFPTTVPWTFTSPPPAVSQPTAAARLKSLDLQLKGDQKMREQKWSEARAAYAASIAAVPGRAESHFRLAVCFVAIQRFDSAIREFKRAVALDPKCVKAAKSLKVLMGPDSHIIRTSIVSKLQEWVREEATSADRQFLLGAMHTLNEDLQSREALETALKLKAGGDASYILRFLNPAGEPVNMQFAGLPEGIPVLNDRAIPPFARQPIADLRFPRTIAQMPRADAPVPMPDGLVPIP